MPSVVAQFQPFGDSTSGEGRIFSRFFNEYCAVTTATSGEDPRTKRTARFYSRGESRICLLGAEMPIPSASDPSTGSKLLCTGGPSQRLRAPATGGRTSNDQNRDQDPAVVKSDASRSSCFGERSVCPASWFKSRLLPTQHLVKAEYFSVFLTSTAR